MLALLGTTGNRVIQEIGYESSILLLSATMQARKGISSYLGSKDVTLVWTDRFTGAYPL